jgi:hypothetical protein
MTRFMMVATVCAALAFAGCAEIQAPSSPPMAGTAAGPGAPPLQQLVGEQPHSANTSDGVATFAGATGDGKPVILRTEPQSGSVGNAPASIGGFPVVGPSSKGGA